MLYTHSIKFYWIGNYHEQKCEHWEPIGYLTDREVKKMAERKSKKKVVEETVELFREFNNSQRKDWVGRIQSDREFRLGKQFTQEQIEELKAKETAPIVINRIHKAIETIKSMLTSNKPGFKVAPQNDSDAKTANALNGLMQYVWYISEGDEQVSQAIDNMLAGSLGWLLAYVDPFSDDGMGDVKFRSVDPKFVYVDPNSQSPDFSDATDIIISRIYTKKQLEQMYPQYKNTIKTATGTDISDELSTGNQSTEYKVIFAGDSISVTAPGREEIRGYERYSKISVTRYRVREAFSKAENLYSEEEFDEYLETPVHIINGNVVKESENAKKVLEELYAQYQQAMEQYHQAIEMGQIDPNSTPPPEEPEYQEATYGDLVKQGLIEVINVMVPRIRMTVILGDKHIYTRIMETSDYPIIPMPNIHTGSPYPISEVAMVKDSQKYLNWLRSIIVRHSQISTNLKVIVPAGSNDIDELRESWNSTNAIIEVDMSEGQPVLANPIPMPSEIFMSEDRVKHEIDDQIGVYDIQSGNAEGGPESYRGILTVDEFGQRRARVKLAAIERAMVRLGRALYHLIREFYTAPKQFRILEPNHTYTEYVINKPSYTLEYEDDYSPPIEILNDVSTGKYDIMFIPGSTLPDNRYAKFQLLLEAYKLELVDRVEVLKKTDIFDIDGVLSRVDTITQLQQQLEQMEGELKKLKGDLQTRDRELFHKRMEVEVVKEREKLRDEVSKHILSMKSSDMDADKAVKLYEQSLQNVLDKTSQEGRLELQRQILAEKERKADSSAK